MIVDQDGHMADAREDEHQGSPHWVLSIYSSNSYSYRIVSYRIVSYRIVNNAIYMYIRYGFHVNNPDEVARGEKPVLTEVTPS